MPQLSMHSPVGSLTVSEEGGAIVALDWGWGRDQEPNPVLQNAIDQLNQFFDGDRRSFDLPLALPGRSFRLRVWSALRAIPFGETTTCGALANRVGGCAQAVGQANRHNPIPIIVPCHRVVAAKGIGGYSAGDIDTKRALLEFEQAVLSPRTSTMDPHR